MAKGYFVVRAEVPDEMDRAPFDEWYATDHLPWAIKVFGAQRGWRCWSRNDPATAWRADARSSRSSKRWPLRGEPRWRRLQSAA